MPSILINELDKTSPGTPGSYNNYTVLIAGFLKTKFDNTELEEATLAARKDVVDANGVYELTPADDFEKIIGTTGTSFEVNDGGAPVYVNHYGNRMAKELLNLGYPVIYAPIENIDDLKKESFWEKFKDKASYDFRFVSHGLLNSATITKVSEEEKEARARLVEVEAAIELLKSIESLSTDKDVQTDVYSEVIGPVNASGTDLTAALNGLVVIEKTTGTGGEEVETKSFYEDFDKAVAGTAAEQTTLKDTIKSLEELATESEESSVFSAADFDEVNGQIANLAKYVADSPESIPGRGDCIALIELNKQIYVDNTSSDKPENLIIKGINNMSTITGENGKYCAMTVPSVYYKMSNEIVEFPGAFHYLACFKNSLSQGFAEWYAAAGYTRGVSSYTVDRTSVKLGEIAINALEPRNRPTQANPKFSCNVIANFRGSYYLWGNRTAEELTSPEGTKGDLVASHFLNIRQICTTIKKQLYVACRRFTFNPNSDTLWFNFVNAIKPTLEAMKADQGIRDYKILKVVEDNPKKATLKAKIRIIPIEAVEDFDLTVYLEDSFGETTAIATE